MKIDTQKAFKAAGIICMLAFLFLLWKGCDPEPGPTVDQARVDSIKAVLEVERAAWQKRSEAFQSESEAQGKEIERLDSALLATKGEALKSAQKASKYASLYDSAKAALDTAGQLAACDSLRWEMDEYTAASDAAIQAADSVIQAQRNQISTQAGYISQQSLQISKEKAATDLVLSEYDKMAKENKKLQRKIRNSKWKMLGSAIAGFLLGTIK